MTWLYKMNYKNKIMEYCRSLGLDTVGIIECRVFSECKEYFAKRSEAGLTNEFEEKEIEKRGNPFFYLEDGKAIISIAFPYLFPMKEESETYFSKYARSRDYHFVVSSYLKKICEFIQELGGKAVYLVDSNALPERYIAAQSGIGFIGKNNMLITKKYGSYVFLGEIITNLELGKEGVKENLCGSLGNCGNCSICLKKCPTGAIGENANKANQCLSYITQKKDIEESWFLKLDGRIFGCDTCQDCCPHNKSVISSPIAEFEPFEYMKKAEYKDLFEIDNETFKDKYKITSAGWRGKNIIQRNALIYMFQSKQQGDITSKKIKSPYIADYYDRLLKKNNL